MGKIIKKNVLIPRVLEFDSGVHFVRPMLMAIAIGVGTGFLVVGFVKSVEWVSAFLFNPAVNGTPWVIFVPVLGGLFVGPWITFLAPEAKGHGIPEVLKALVLRAGRIRPIVVLVKTVASIVSIGSGFSVGREGPITQIGAAFGSAFGQLLKLPTARLKNLVACGAAGGIAGVFNTPIAGVMFASEVILRDFGADALSTIVVAAVSSSIISRIFLGDHPSFMVPTYHMQNPLEILLYFGLGILSALAAVFFIVTLEWMETRFEQWRFPEWLKPACGGLLIGLIGFRYPQIFGSGLPTIESALHGSIPLQILLALILIKTFATSISIGAGSSGGVFAPLLFIGAVLGGAFGQVANTHYFVPIAPNGAYALVGMASVFSAAARAPITSILIVFELTGSYGMILPIMAAAVTATSISQLILRDSIYLRRLKHKGIDIKSFEETRMIGGLRVRDAMTQDFQVVAQDTPAKEFIELMSKDMNKIILVVDQNKMLSGIIKPAEINKILVSETIDFINAYDAASPVKDYTLPDEALNEAARLMSAHHLTELPVVDSLDISKIIGILRSEDIFRVYSEHISKKEDVVNQAAHDQVLPAEMLTITFTVTPRSPIVGKLIKQLKLPEGIHFNVIKRSDQFFVPHGNVQIMVNDRIIAMVMPQKESSFREWLRETKLKNF